MVVLHGPIQVDGVVSALSYMQLANDFVNTALVASPDFQSADGDCGRFMPAATGDRQPAFLARRDQSSFIAKPSFTAKSCSFCISFIPSQEPCSTLKRR